MKRFSTRRTVDQQSRLRGGHGRLSRRVVRQDIAKDGAQPQETPVLFPPHTVSPSDHCDILQGSPFHPTGSVLRSSILISDAGVPDFVGDRWICKGLVHGLLSPRVIISENRVGSRMRARPAEMASHLGRAVVDGWTHPAQARQNHRQRTIGLDSQPQSVLLQVRSTVKALAFAYRLKCRLPLCKADGKSAAERNFSGRGIFKSDLTLALGTTNAFE